MSDIPRKLLCSLIQQKGISIIQDSKNFQNLLSDYFKGEYKKERKCLIDALSEDVPIKLQNKKDHLAYSTISQQISQKLINDLGITADLAKWTVDSWAIALGVIQDTELKSKDFTVTILSNPPGAKTSINGKLRGITPITLNSPELATYQIQVFYDGYETWKHSLEITSWENTTVSANLLPKDFSLTIISIPPGAGVSVNGILKGITPLKIANPEMKTHQIQISLEKYYPWSQSQEITSRENVTLTANLIPKPEESGSIILETYPSNAEIYLNSKKVGRTPKELVNLSPGYYEIRLTSPGYKEIIVHKQIRAGRNITITESFIQDPIIIPDSNKGKNIGDSFPNKGNKDSAKNWYNQGVDFSELKEYEKALWAYNNALSYDDKDPDIWNNVCYVLIKLGKYEEAIKAGNKGVVFAPNDPEIWDNLRDAYLANNDIEQADECLKKISKIDPTELERLRSPLLAILFSFFFPGWGQWYNGKTRDGLKFCGAFWGSFLLLIFVASMATTQPFASILILLTFALMIGIWMYGMYDSYKTADRINRKKESFYRKSIFFWLSVTLLVIIIAAVIAAFVFPVSNTTNIQTSSEIPSSNNQITDKNLAVRSYGDFLQEGQTNTYYFDINNENAGGKLLKIIAQGQPGTKITSAVGINYVPSIENRKFDFISEANSDSVIDINNPQPGRYFVTVKGVKGSGDTRVSRSFY